MIKIAIFASGSGSNAENISAYFKNSKNIEVALIATNNPSAYVLDRAKNLNIPTYIFSKQEFSGSDTVLNTLTDYEIDFIVLAGFLLLIPQSLIEAYPNRIINIHPALLPKYGGKGMYGDRVHEAIVRSGDRETGISIHYVNANYDEGELIFQATCPVTDQDTTDTIAAKVHQLEYKHYPAVIESVIREAFNIPKK